MRFYLKKIYEISCFFYSRIVEVLENYFLRRNFKSKNRLYKDGFLKIKKNTELKISKQKFDFILNDNQECFFPNKYHKKLILSRENLNSVIRLIFDRQFCDFLTLQTGFKYSIDFFSAYQNFAISEEEKDQPWYANHYHLDKPNSKNMLKVFIPMSEIEMSDGPLELIDMNQTKEYLIKKKNIEEAKKTYFVGGLGDVFLCKLNVCFHKAKIPFEGHTTNLIMIQLNPSRKWYLSAKLYQRQFKMEPKFTSFINNFTKRIVLK